MRKRMTLKLLALILVSMTGLTSSFAQYQMDVLKVDDSKAAFAVSEVQKMIFENGNSMSVVKNDATSTAFALGDIQAVSFAGGSTGLTSTINEANNFNLYPTVVSSSLNISYALDQPTVLSLELFNVQGQTVLNQSYGVVQGDNVVTLGVSQLKSGVYFCRISYDGQVATKKLVKQ